MKKFGENLIKTRIVHGLSQEQLELQSEKSKNQVGNIERGEVNTTISKIKRLSDTLKVKPKHLFDFEIT